VIALFHVVHGTRGVVRQFRSTKGIPLLVWVRPPVDDKAEKLGGRDDFDNIKAARGTSDLELEAKFILSKTGEWTLTVPGLKIDEKGQIK
jgi:hypothetical protein